MIYKEVTGDLIELALRGDFDVIAHGVNCQCVQKSGLAPQMVKAFRTDTFIKELPIFKGDINKLGTIDFKKYGKDRLTGEVYKLENMLDVDNNFPIFHVVNAYTQFNYGSNHADGNIKPIDYEAITLCMRKINHTFKGQHIGLPGLIGCGLAGGNPEIVEAIIRKEFKDCDVTIVYLNGK